MPLSNLNKELLDSIKGEEDLWTYKATNTSDVEAFNMTISRISSCVQRGASINETKLLHFAIANKKNNLIAFLISLGAEINLQDESGCTALHIASRLQNNEGSNILLALGANATILDNKGMSYTEHGADSLIKSQMAQRDFCRMLGIQPREGLMNGLWN